MSDPCSFLHSVIQDEFGFLLTERGYVLVGEDPNGGYGCAIVLEGNAIRVKFYTDQGEPLNILVGDASAPRGWEQEIDGVRKWHYLSGIAGYLEGDLAVGERVLLKSKEEWSSERRSLSGSMSALLRKHIAEIEGLFSAGRFEEIQKDYDDYRKAVDARTRAALELRAGRR